MKLVYIAGPFRAPTPLEVRRNVERARDLGFQVAELGACPVIPHTMNADFDKLLQDQFWLDATMELLRRCDAIVLTENWQSSFGAVQEQLEAAKRGMRVFYSQNHGRWRQDLLDWISQ